MDNRINLTVGSLENNRIRIAADVIIHIPRVRRRGLPWEWEGEEGQLWLR
jgi:hypothetical protein